MMNLRELKTPIRIYWDVTPTTEVRPGYQRICEEIVGIRILSLNLVDTDPSISGACLQILERLKNENIAVSLALPGSAINPQVISLLHNLHVRALFLMASSLDELRPLQDIWHEKKVLLPGIYFEVRKDNHKTLPELLSFCLDNDVPYLVLPMQRLTKERDCFYLDQREREELTARVHGIGIPARIKLIIHDPFLWKVFFPSVEFPEGGCQAANTMLYISPEGDVYPCPSMPVKLGSLMEATLKDIIFSKEKKELREKIVRAPAGCAHCAELPLCTGGCRGRAYAANNSLDVPDPGCM
ncbi:MAG: Fe-S oxidoreductase-like [Geobacteraceae bacterium]|nr:MAG: Fe-S oxidoreductase-like [Geobacteraceae bacterium]